MKLTRASKRPEIVYILIVDKTSEVIDMALEGQLTMEARKARPEARVRFERNGQILTMFWEWEYKGQKLSYSRAELRQDYEKDPEMVGAVVDFCVIQMGILEKGIDDAAPR